MSEMQTESTSQISASESAADSERDDWNPVLADLQKVIGEFLAANPQLTLNALSKRCGVSEPTLRRLMKGQVKSLASVTTVVDILTYISKESTLYGVTQRYPGVLADYLRENLGFACDEKASYDYAPQLNEALKDPLKYLIYKRAANASGVTEAEIEEMFGYFGKLCLQDLVNESLIESRDQRYFGKFRKFTLSHDWFVRCFKATADFIKPEKLDQAKLNNLFLNFSRSLTPAAYQELIRIQQTAIRKCIQLLDDPKSQGEIPAFMLVAIDTLSKKSAAEIRRDLEIRD
jgi:transcriptional regulator with XRE-family HTH domain